MKPARVLISIGFLLVYSLTAAAQIGQAPAKAEAKKNPFLGNDRAGQAGAKLYERECSSCHGAKGEGTKSGQPLAGGAIRSAAAGKVFWVLTNGSLRRGMPSFAHLPEARRWQIITFLQERLK